MFINAKVGQNIHLICTALAPNKLEGTYREVLEKLRDVVAENGHCLDPVFAHCDCEMGIINAITSVFPHCQKRLCLFHIKDAWRRNGDTNGLRPVKKDKPDFKKCYQRLGQILFFPIDYWPRLLKLIVDGLAPETKEHPSV